MIMNFKLKEIDGKIFWDLDNPLPYLTERELYSIPSDSIFRLDSNYI